MFLASIDEPIPDRVDIALDAFQDDRLLIGVAVLAAAADHGIGLLAVHPGIAELMKSGIQAITAQHGRQATTTSMPNGRPGWVVTRATRSSKEPRRSSD